MRASEGFALRQEGGDVIRILPTGLWTPEVVAAFVAELDRLAARHGRKLRVLVDAREHGILPQAAAQQLEKSTQDLLRVVSHLAVLVSGTLQKLQNDRINTTGRTRIFYEEADALRYLRND